MQGFLTEARELAGEMYRAMAIDVGEYQDDVCSGDQSPEALNRCGAAHMPGVNFGVVSGGPCKSHQPMGVSVQATYHADQHVSARRKCAGAASFVVSMKLTIRLF